MSNADLIQGRVLSQQAEARQTTNILEKDCAFCGRKITDGKIAEIRLGDFKIYPSQSVFSPGNISEWLHDYCYDEVAARVGGYWNYYKARVNKGQRE